MAEVIWAEINGEKVALKKNKYLGWKVVQPIRNSDGTLNWFNLVVGGWPGLITLGFYALLALGIYLGINEILSGCKAMAANPCAYCKLGLMP